MPAKHTIYEDKKQFQHTSCSLMGERRKTNLVRVIGAEIEITMGGHKRATWLSPTTPEKTFQKRGQCWGTWHLPLCHCLVNK